MRRSTCISRCTPGRWRCSLIAVAWPEPLARVAGLALALSAAMLLRNLIVAARRYRSDSMRGPDAGQPTAHLRVS